MTLYLCEMADTCSEFDCHHHNLHKEVLNDKGTNVCITPFPCFNYTTKLLRCFIYDDKKEREEKTIYFIKRKKK
jgi:hypothetical protein